MVNAPLLNQFTLGGLFTTIELSATLAFALSGVLVAARKELDAVGVVVVAFLAAFGGGTIRDVLLDRRPFFWVSHPHHLWAVLLVCAVSMMVLRSRHFQMTERAMMWPDALGLGLFAATGTQIALEMRLPALVAVLMGVVTPVFGGVIRDIVCNEIPTAFRDHRPYAICAFLGGWVVVIATALGGSGTISLVAGALVATAVRLAALYFDWKLPAWRAKQ